MLVSRYAVALSLGLCNTGAALAQIDVRVAVDMDPAVAGFQSSVRVPPGTETIPGVAVYIWDITRSHEVHAIGCGVCAVLRGITFGHHRGEGRVIGRVEEVAGEAVTPAITGGLHTLFGFSLLSPFNGPTVEYFAEGPGGPAFLQPLPREPQFVVDISLENATAGDVYSFYLFDVIAGGGGGGVFAASDPFAFDAGGDAVADMTPTTLGGFDLDQPAPSPPAPFLVDYVDGPVSGGGARVFIDGCYADLTQNGVLDIFDFVEFQDLFAAGAPQACDCDQTGGRGICDIFDFLCFQDAFAEGCR